MENEINKKQDIEYIKEYFTSENDNDDKKSIFENVIINVGDLKIVCENIWREIEFYNFNLKKDNKIYGCHSYDLYKKIFKFYLLLKKNKQELKKQDIKLCKEKKAYKILDYIIKMINDVDAFKISFAIETIENFKTKKISYKRYKYLMNKIFTDDLITKIDDMITNKKKEMDNKTWIKEETKYIEKISNMFLTWNYDIKLDRDHNGRDCFYFFKTNE